jgi:glutamyl-tRNA reductase
MNRPPVLFVLGASHHTTPIELREKIALGAQQIPQFRRQLEVVPGLRELAILNTCNRIEFYGLAEPEAILALQQEFCRRQGLPAAEFERIRLHETGPGAIRHLLEVASGLDSQMIGENEIFGQVKEAYAEAQAARTVGPVLNRIFQKGFQAAKYVRTHTAITEGQISTANVAVDLAGNIFGDVARARVLLLGAGEIGEKTARAFKSRGVVHLTVASRTLSRAMELASALEAAALPFEHVDKHLSDFDIVVCATAAPGAVLTQSLVAPAMRQRRAQPLFLIDLALPRDVEAEVAQLENVFLYNLDDLARIVDHNRAARAAEVHKAKAIVEERTTTLWRQIENQCASAAAAPAWTTGQGLTSAPEPR